MLRAVTLFLLLPLAAQAGPWLKQPGEQFLSTSVSYQMPPAGGDVSVNTSLYYERGIKKRLTLGFDYSLTPNVEETGIAFARIPLSKNEGPARSALEMGLGWYATLISAEPVAKATYTWGRGFQRKNNSGWMTVDASLTSRIRSKALLGKLEGTIGLTVSPKTKWMLQLSLERQNQMDELGITITPSFARKLWKNNYIQIGLLAQTYGSNNQSLGLKFALWQSF
jgi:hypothetical protein